MFSGTKDGGSKPIRYRSCSVAPSIALSVAFNGKNDFGTRGSRVAKELTKGQQKLIMQSYLRENLIGPNIKSKIDTTLDSLI